MGEDFEAMEVDEDAEKAMARYERALRVWRLAGIAHGRRADDAPVPATRLPATVPALHAAAAALESSALQTLALFSRVDEFVAAYCAALVQMPFVSPERRAAEQAMIEAQQQRAALALQQQHALAAASEQQQQQSGDAPPAKRRCSHNCALPPQAVQVLREWLVSHCNDPYPSAAERKQLADAGGISETQVCNWLVNARRRVLQPILQQQQQH